MFKAIYDKAKWESDAIIIFKHYAQRLELNATVAPSLDGHYPNAGRCHG